MAEKTRLIVSTSCKTAEILDACQMIEFDNSTLANMTAALDDGCKTLSGELDTSENRKRIGDAIITAANSGKRTLAQFSEVALAEVKLISGSKPSMAQSAVDWIKRRF
jgi:hypothetical protein